MIHRVAPPLLGLTLLLATHLGQAQGQSHIDHRLPITRCEEVVNAYCSAFAQYREDNGRHYFRLKNGKELECDDGRYFDLSNPRQYIQRLNDSDLKSVKAYVYPHRQQLRYPLPVFGWDPGRFRNEVLLDAVYGSTKKEVERNLVRVNFLGKKISFNKQNGAAEALAKVGQEIEQRYPQIAKKFWQVREFAGTYNWRKIDGTNLRSVHSWGAAIDMTNWSKPQYWKWVAKCRPNVNCDAHGKNEATLIVDTNIDMDEFSFPGEPHPQAIVEVFEKHGFIWGGKWHHFDSMHFEYRPEFSERRKHCPLVDGVSLR